MDAKLNPLTANNFRQINDPLRLTKYGGKLTDPIGMYKDLNPEQKAQPTNTSSTGSGVRLSTNRGTGLQI